MKVKGGDKGWSHQPVWADADDWYERQLAEQELEQLEQEQAKAARQAAAGEAAGAAAGGQDAMAALEAAGDE